jgi:hypothetical protein
MEEPGCDEQSQELLQVSAGVLRRSNLSVPASRPVKLRCGDWTAIHNPDVETPALGRRALALLLPAVVPSAGEEAIPRTCCEVVWVPHLPGTDLHERADS